MWDAFQVLKDVPLSFSYTVGCSTFVTSHGPDRSSCSTLYTSPCRDSELTGIWDLHQTDRG